MNKSYTELIEIAQRNLITRPFDAGHNIFHHYEVFKNAFLIVSKENISAINEDHLYVACWWHDFERGSSEHNVFVKAAEDVGLEKKEIDTILKIINNHSLSKTQTKIEEKVIFDADKLEYFNILRWEYIVNDFETKNITKEQILEYIGNLNSRTSDVLSRLSFEYTRNRMKIEIEQFLNYVKSLPEENILKINLNSSFLIDKYS